MRLSEATKDLCGYLVADGDFSCIAFATEEEQAGFLTFLEREKFASALENPNIACVLVTKELVDCVPAHIKGIFICDKPKAMMFALHNRLAGNVDYIGERFETKIGNNCTISPMSVIDPYNVKIGDNVTIEPFVVIKGRVTIGNNVVIRSGSIIGCKGFSFAHDENGKSMSVIDTARIVIEDDVEIFEHVTITTGLFPWEKTLIGEGTKIDVLSFVAHGSIIGKNCMLAGGCKCCGNCRVGNDVWIGPGAVLSNRIEVGDNARVSIGSVVTKNVPANMTVSGNFAIDHQKFMSNLKKSIKGMD